MAKASDPWIEASDVIPMFPTLLWKILVKPGLRDAIDAKILAMLESMRRDLQKVKYASHNSSVVMLAPG